MMDRGSSGKNDIWIEGGVRMSQITVEAQRQSSGGVWKLLCKPIKVRESDC